MAPMQEEFKKLKKLVRDLKDVNDQLDHYRKKYIHASIAERSNRTTQEIQIDFDRVRNLNLRAAVLKWQSIDSREDLLEKINVTG